MLLHITESNGSGVQTVFITIKPTEKISRASRRFKALLMITFPLQTGTAMVVSLGRMCLTV